MKNSRIIAAVILPMLVPIACSSPKKTAEAENAPNSVSGFCHALSMHGHRNVNLETCIDTGVLEKEPQSSKTNRYPSTSSIPYIFQGKLTRHGLPIQCLAQWTEQSTWIIRRCENSPE